MIKINGVTYVPVDEVRAKASSSESSLSELLWDKGYDMEDVNYSLNYVVSLLKDKEILKFAKVPVSPSTISELKKLAKATSDF